VTVQFL